MQGRLLLSVAAEAGKMDEVDRLLAQGVDMNAYGLIDGPWGSEVDAVLQAAVTFTVKQNATIHAMSGQQLEAGLMCSH